MRLFKNRGDIYIPKSGKGNSKEARILYVLLVFIVLFTVAFVIFMSNKYKSAAAFFGDGEVTLTEAADNNELILPSISGKTNYLIIETDDEETFPHYLILLQADKDNLAYKAAALSSDMVIDDKSVKDIYLEGGGAALQTRLAEYLGCEIDYYAEFTSSSFVDFTDKLGNIIYPVISDIRFSGGSEDDKYTIHFNEGEQKLSGRDITNLLRYFGEENKDYSLESELALRAVTGLINAENYENAESLFRLFIKSGKTDITVRDFENNKNSIYVFAQKSTEITLYNVTTEFDENNVITQNAVKEIKGYFSK